MVGSTFGFVELLEKWGIERRVSKAGECKTGVDLFLPVDPAARQRQQTLLDDLHAEFISIVRERRGAKLQLEGAEGGKIFEAEVYVGTKAQRLGLVDGLGSLEEVMKAKLGPSTRFRVLDPKANFIGLRVPGLPRHGEGPLPHPDRGPAPAEVRPVHPGLATQPRQQLTREIEPV